MTDWQPSASINQLKRRAQRLAAVRAFFEERDIVEVETPVLSQYGVTDRHIDQFITHHFDQPYYLQSSPEYAMKRLLAAGSGPIYQLCKCFRHESAGQYHNPEFTMLEWYQPGDQHHDLMESISDFLAYVFHWPRAKKISYQALFESQLHINPITCSLNALQRLTRQKINIDHINTFDRDDLMQLLLTHLIEPQLGHTEPLFIYDYPASQAALATIDHQQTPPIAQRFELYIKGVECANGFHELTDASEQYQRFKKDQTDRQAHQKDSPTIDPRFIAALESGLPPCSGVAMGIDRLIMLDSQHQKIQEGLSFHWAQA